MVLIAGIFIIMHGLVHGWYVVLSRGWVEYQPEMGWTGRSWLLSSLLGDGPTRVLASVLYTLAGLALVASGVGLIAGAEWVKPVIIASAAFSAVVILIFWDGSTEKLVPKGLLGLIANLCLLGIAFNSI